MLWYIRWFTELISDVKLFVDDTSFFRLLVVLKLLRNSDLLQMQHLAYHWKTSFNPDRAKQAQEAVFSRKTTKIVHPHVFFKNTTAEITHTQKCLGLHLDKKSFFSEHTNSKISKVLKVIGLLLQLERIFLRRLLIIYK